MRSRLTLMRQAQFLKVGLNPEGVNPKPMGGNYPAILKDKPARLLPVSPPLPRFTGGHIDNNIPHAGAVFKEFSLCAPVIRDCVEFSKISLCLMALRPAQQMLINCQSSPVCGADGCRGYPVSGSSGAGLGAGKRPKSSHAVAASASAVSRAMIRTGFSNPL